MWSRKWRKQFASFFAFDFTNCVWGEVQLASYNGIQDILAWVLDSSSWIPDSTHWIPVFVSGTWILDSNRKCDSGWAVFRIPKTRILHSTRKNFSNSGFHKQKFPGCRWGKTTEQWRHPATTKSTLSYITCTYEKMKSKGNIYIVQRISYSSCTSSIIQSIYS